MTYADTITNRTPEELAVQLQQATGRDRRPLEAALWVSVEKLLTAWARGYFNRCPDACKRRGVELDDLTNAQFETMRRAAAAYKAESGLAFSTYLKYHFRTVCAETMNARTARGQNEPLNNCTSLDTPTDSDDPDGSTLKDFVKDPNAEFIEGLFEGLTLQQIGDRLHVTGERAAQIERGALRRLRQNRQLRLVYLDSEEQKRLAKATKRAESLNPLLSCYMTDAARQALDLIELMKRETIAAYLAGDTPEQRAADRLLEMI